MANIYWLVRMHKRELNWDQNLIDGQMAVQNWTEINAWKPIWCNAIYGWTRFKFRFDPGSKLNDVGATRVNGKNGNGKKATGKNGNR